MHLKTEMLSVECGKCRTMRPVSEFPVTPIVYRPRKGGAARKRIAPRGRRLSWCKLCKKIYDQQRRVTHRESIAKVQLENYLRHLADGRHSYWRSLARARSKNVTVTVTLAEWRIIMQSPACHWCATPLHISIRNIDHLVPLSEGGEHSASNLAATCANCNMRRSWERKTKYLEGRM